MTYRDTGTTRSCITSVENIIGRNMYIEARAEVIIDTFIRPAFRMVVWVVGMLWSCRWQMPLTMIIEPLISTLTLRERLVRATMPRLSLAKHTSIIVNRMDSGTSTLIMRAGPTLPRKTVSMTTVSVVFIITSARTSPTITATQPFRPDSIITRRLLHRPLSLPNVAR